MLEAAGSGVNWRKVGHGKLGLEDLKPKADNIEALIVGETGRFREREWDIEKSTERCWKR